MSTVEARLTRGLIAVLALGVSPVVAAPPGAMPEAVRQLPAKTAVAVYAPRLQPLLEGARRALSVGLHGGAARRSSSPHGALAALLWGRERPCGPAPEHGLDLEGSVVIRVLPDLGSAVFILPVVDRDQFRRWLGALPAPSQDILERDKTPISVLGARTPWPLACAFRKAWAVCQVGLGPPGDGLAPLAEHLPSGDPQKGPRLGSRRALTRIWPKTPTKGPRPEWTAVIRPRLLVRGAFELYRQHQLHANRVASRDGWAQLAQRMMHQEEQSVRWARALEAVALTGSMTDSTFDISLMAELTSPAARQLARVLPRGSSRRQLRRWVRTPALLSLFVHAHPVLVARLGRTLGLDMDARSLDGSIGVLALGVNLRAPSARRTSPEPLRLHDLFPYALAAGLGGPEVPARGASLASFVAHSSTSMVAETVERHLVVGSRASGAYAALRRWQAAHAMGPPPPDGFLFATVDLGAIDAALAGARITRDHRPELRRLERFRRRWTPVWEGLESLRLVGTADPTRRRVRLRLRLGS